MRTVLCAWHGRMRVARLAAGVAAMLAAASAVAAQELSGGVDLRHDTLRYRFDNPSTFDTPSLVPHVFEQTYDAGNVWVVVAARYGRALRWETRLGATPRRATTADDYDTFFDPDGTVWVTGTTGPAVIRSISIEQRAFLGDATPGRQTWPHGGRWYAAYGFRGDWTEFGVGHKTLTRNGVVIAATDVTSRESTSSQVHEFGAGAAWRFGSAGNRWHAELDVEGTPLAIGRLVVRLPDKYANEDLVYVAYAFGAAARVELTRRLGTWLLGFGGDAGTTWSYRSTAQLDLTASGIHITMGRRW